MRTVAAGRKAFLFVGSERAGHAAAIYYSFVESCKAHKGNPRTYLTYVLNNVSNRTVVPPTPDELATLSIAPAGALFNNLEHDHSSGRTWITGWNPPPVLTLSLADLCMSIRLRPPARNRVYADHRASLFVPRAVTWPGLKRAAKQVKLQQSGVRSRSVYNKKTKEGQDCVRSMDEVRNVARPAVGLEPTFTASRDDARHDPQWLRRRW